MSSHDMGQLLGTETSLMEMTEVEYTHLQHILFQTHIDGQAATAAADPDGLDVRFPTTVFGRSVTATTKMIPSPTTQAIDLSTSNDEQCVVSELRPDETVDIQELDMVMACSGSGSGGGGHPGEKTPSTCGELPGSVPTRARREVGETLTEAPAHSGGSSLSRSYSSARVCLEKRFSCVPEDVPRQQDTQTAVLTNFLAMLQQSTESQEASIHPQMQKWIKSDRINPIELSNPYGGGLFNPITGVCGQVFGHISHIVEPNKHQGLINTNNFGYRPERAAAKAQCISRTDPGDGQKWVKVEKEAVPTAPVKRARARILRVPGVAPPLEGTKAAVEAARSGRKRAGTPAESSQRREKHNNKERDRRRKIRMCCDELNTLVPFCKPDTDKASTLQWTTAFLQHIQEVYGDSLKENFESTFCGKTGLRLKPSTDSDQLHQEVAGTPSPEECSTLLSV